MADETSFPQSQAPSADTMTIVRDFEEKQRLLRDRVILLGKTVVDDRDKTFSELQQMKKDLIQLKEDVKRIKELLERITEQLTGVARKEELLILQRQLDLLRRGS